MYRRDLVLLNLNLSDIFKDILKRDIFCLKNIHDILICFEKLMISSSNIPLIVLSLKSFLSAFIKVISYFVRKFEDLIQHPRLIFNFCLKKINVPSNASR